METIRTIIIHSQEVKKDKQSFIANSAEINGKWHKIKFTKECVDVPKKRGLYELVIDFDTCSVEHGRKFVKSDGTIGKQNDTIWVRHIVGIRQYSEEELRAKNRAALSEIFGDNE